MEGVDEHEVSLISAARSGDEGAFGQLTEPHRLTLHNHCYRMLGSLHDAEDAVQETFLRSWRGMGAFRGASSVQTWLYSIATRVCLDSARKRSRRTLPQHAVASSSPSTPPGQPTTEFEWLEPYPSTFYSDAGSPEATAVAAETVTLAFVAVLQALSARQRAILLLIDVLDWRPREVADALESSERAVNSALHRARTKVTQLYHRDGATPQEIVPNSSVAKGVSATLSRYVAAWRSGDAQALASMLREDAILSMPPILTWYSGRDAIVEALSSGILAGKEGPGWYLVEADANADAGFLVYRQAAAGEPAHFFGVQLVDFEDAKIKSITTFLDPRLASFFNASESISPD